MFGIAGLQKSTSQNGTLPAMIGAAHQRKMNSE
jgi:hypothetical protein